MDDAYARLIEESTEYYKPKYKIGDKLIQKLSNTIFTIIQIYESESVEGVFLYDIIINEDNSLVWSEVNEKIIDEEFIRLRNDND